MHVKVVKKITGLFDLTVVKMMIMRMNSQREEYNLEVN